MEPTTEPPDNMLAVYNATMESPLLANMNKKIYDLLFHRGAMTTGEIDEVLETKNCRNRLVELSFFGVVTKAEKRICSVTGRTATTWVITGNGPVAKTKERVYYPTHQDLNEFVRDLTIMAAQVRTSNARLSIEFRNVMDWLKAGAPCKHEGHVVVRASKHAKRVKSNV